MPNSKPTNPKDAIGIKKTPMSTVSAPVMMEVGLGMMEGACKYGRHNYRVIGVHSSVYYDATMRHLADWWEGTDIDPDSGLSHVTKAICSLVVLRDAMIQGQLNDDRPPPAPAGWLQDLNKKAEEILARYPEPEAPYTGTGRGSQDRCPVPAAQYHAQSTHAAHWAADQVRRLLDDGYAEIAPGVFSNGTTVVEF